MPRAKKDFFISFTRQDREWAEWISWTLEEAGYSVIFQDWDFRPGQLFPEEMNRAALDSKQMLLVLSNAYLRSGFAKSEWMAGFVEDPDGRRRRLLPVRIGKFRSHPLLNPRVYTDLVGVPETEARQRLLDALRPRVKPDQKPAFPGARSAKGGATSRPSFPGGSSPAASNPARAAAPVPEQTFAAEIGKMKQSLAGRPAAAAPAGHYAEALRLLTGGKLVPFLGLGVHFDVADNAWGAKWLPDAAFFPSPTEYCNYLAQFLPDSERVESGTELTRVYQYLDETRGRVFVQSAVHRLYDRDYPHKSAHAFLATLNSVVRASGRNRPVPLIVTTNLDDVLEQTFRRVGEPFSVVSYVSGGADQGRLRFRSSEGQTQVLRTRAQLKRVAQTEPTMILKLHGGVDRDDPERESMVLTEDEVVSYFGSPAALELLPELIKARVGDPRFLFLGYSLRDWNIRFLLARLWTSKRREMSWAVLYKTTKITKLLWGKRGVEILDLAIEGYVAGLAQEAARRS